MVPKTKLEYRSAPSKPITYMCVLSELVHGETDMAPRQIVDTGLDETSCFFADGGGEEVAHGHYYEELGVMPFSSSGSATSSSGSGTSGPIDGTSLGNSSTSSYTYSSSYTSGPITSMSTTTTSYGSPSPSPVGSSRSTAVTPPTTNSSFAPGAIPPPSSPVIFEGGDFPFSLDRRKVGDLGSVRL